MKTHFGKDRFGNEVAVLPRPVIRLPKKKRKEVSYPVSCLYNGGTEVEGRHVKGYHVPRPIVPKGWRIYNLGCGLQYNSRPPYATNLLVAVKP